MVTHIRAQFKTNMNGELFFFPRNFINNFINKSKNFEGINPLFIM